MYEYISQYKFYLSLENSKLDAYITEKIVNAMNSGTIPIYWGDEGIFEYVNRDAIIFVETYEQALEEIIFLD
jgi:hypothetical protein